MFYPTVLEEEIKDTPPVSRTLMPATWLIATTNDDRGNVYNIRKLLRQQVGDISNARITRFGRNSFLIHAKSLAQAAMISNLKTGAEGLLKEIRPHFSFSYTKGVVFSRDLYELPEDEILGMCPDNVWKVFKVPKSSMIILTFNNDHLPFYVVIDSEKIDVRPYRPRPLQCFNCFKFGHPSRVCKWGKLCRNCSLSEHGDCSETLKCVNCKEGHDARNRKCKIYIMEE